MSSALFLVKLLFLVSTILNIDTHVYGDVRFVHNCIFSTKTPYFWIKSNDEIIKEDSESICKGPHAATLPKSCVSFHINSLIRHGIRYPGLKWIKRMDEVHQKLTNLLISSSQSGFIKRWANPFPNDKEHALAPSGKLELLELGKRFGQRFKLLFEEETDKVQYFVSSKERTIDSRRAFHDGLINIFPSDVNDDNYKVPIVDDSILRFHSGCQKYLNQIENNDTALGEYFKFKNGLEMKSVVNNVKKRIVDDVDLTETNTISGDDVQTIHQICAFELSFFGKSDWCRFFEKEDMEVIDYLNDLKHYWQKAYGYKLSSDMSCPLVRHIFQKMDDAVNDFEDGEDFTVGLFRFAHAETLLPLYAALGLFKDSEPLMASNYERHANRLFRSSKIAPFAANIAFVLYECDSNSDDEEDNADDDIDDEDEESIYVKLFVNEEAILIPACGEVLCRYTDVREYYSHLIDKCDIGQICEVDRIKDHDEL